MNRRNLTCIVALFLILFATLPTALSQVVIKERIVLDPDSAQASLEVVQGPTAYSWPGSVRGRGTLKFFLSPGALLRIHPLSALSATLTTTKGQSYVLPLASTGAQTGQRTVCEPSEDPDWTACTEWTYGGGLLTEIRLDSD